MAALLGLAFFALFAFLERVFVGRWNTTKR
jgi:hypothetical protein